MDTFSEYQHCQLCPRACGTDRTRSEQGVCGASHEVEVARSALHFWEEPPISGTSGSGTIFFTHCALGCSYCQNNEISRGTSYGALATEADLADMMLSLQAQGALNINLVTPTHYAPTLRAAINNARGKGLALPVLWNTSGYETVDAIRKNEGTVDAYLTDFKYANNKLASALSNASNYPTHALSALRTMIETAGEVSFDIYRGEERLTGGVIVRHLLLPGHVQESKEAIALLHAEFGDAIRISIMNQYTPVLVKAAKCGDARAQKTILEFPELACTVTDDEYEELLDFADELYPNGYYFQQGETCSESFIPAFNEG